MAGIMSWSTVTTTSVTLVLFVLLSLLSTLSWSHEQAIVLQPGSPMATKLLPYEIYEILVPVDTLTPGQMYSVGLTWDGGLSQEIVVKRKKRELEAVYGELYDRSDFKRRRGGAAKAIDQRKLKDDIESVNFQVTEEGVDVNDPKGTRWEMYSDDSGRNYIVFTMSVFKISMAYDDELMMQEVEVGLTIYPEQGKLSLFSTHASFLIVAVICTVIVLVAFFLALYFFVLPDHMRKNVFGIANKDAEGGLSKTV